MPGFRRPTLRFTRKSEKLSICCATPDVPWVDWGGGGALRLVKIWQLLGPPLPWRGSSDPPGLAKSKALWRRASANATKKEAGGGCVRHPPAVTGWVEGKRHIRTYGMPWKSTVSPCITFVRVCVCVCA